MRTEQVTFDIVDSIRERELARIILLTILPLDSGWFLATHPELPVDGTGPDRESAVESFKQNLVDYRHRLAAELLSDSPSRMQAVDAWRMLEAYWGEDENLLIIQE